MFCYEWLNSFALVPLAPTLTAALTSTIATAWTCSKFYLFWMLAHYASSHCYVHFCTPGDVMGFITSPFRVMTPHCIALDWVQRHSRDFTKQMWLYLGTYAAAKLLSSLTPS